MHCTVPLARHQTVHWWCQGGPSPPPPPGEQHDRRPKSGAYLPTRREGGGGTSTVLPQATTELLEPATLGKSEKVGKEEEKEGAARV